VRLPGDRADLYRGRFAGPAGEIVIARPLRLLLRLLTRGDIGFAESYMEGDWETPDLPGLLDVLQLNEEHLGAGPKGLRWSRRLDRLTHRLRDNRPGMSRRNIARHYDLGNDFYRLWLDEGMVYSCAYFENGDEDLATAQRKKLDHILTKIRLQPGQRLLDIGCGWGALVLRAAQHFGAHCVGVTLSRNQFEAATERVRAAGLADRIEIRLQDYRDVQGRFDRITSVGMFEHVGRRNLPMYFAHMRELLADDGLALNHGITSTDADVGATALGGGAFIDRYVFPDGELPHLSLALEAMQRGGLEVLDVEGLRRHYVRTLQLWLERFEGCVPEIRALVGEERFRIWRVYLAGCAYAFEHDDVSIFQVVCRRAGQGAASLAWSRRYMYERELS